jgi:hypothetical protein
VSCMIKELRELEAKAFRAPWAYDAWEIECPTCKNGDECANPECDGDAIPCTMIESPEEYPDGQTVALVTVPGLSSLADANGAFIVALRNAATELLDAAEERDRLRAENERLRAREQELLEACTRLREGHEGRTT